VGQPDGRVAHRHHGAAHARLQAPDGRLRLLVARDHFGPGDVAVVGAAVLLLLQWLLFSGRRWSLFGCDSRGDGNRQHQRCCCCCVLDHRGGQANDGAV